MSMAIVAAIAAPLIIGGVTAAINKGKANNMQNDVLNAQNAADNLAQNRQEIFDASGDIRAMKAQLTNAYANVGVATQAAEMQQQQTDVALANMMEGMVQTGSGAASATALAQAAAKSKQGISANIEQQEIANTKLRAQGEQQLQQQRLSLETQAITAEGQAWELAEGREVFDINRAQAEADFLRNQQAAYQAAASGAMAEGAAGSAQVAAAYAGSGSGK